MLQKLAYLVLAGAVSITGIACSGSSGSSPTQPANVGSARIVSLDSVEPRGPQTLVSLPEAAADLVTLSFTMECEPRSPGDSCHLGFDFLDANGKAVPRGPGSGEFVGAGTHTMEAAGAPKSFTGDTVGVRAYVTLNTTAVELASLEFRRGSLSYTWTKE